MTEKDTRASTPRRVRTEMLVALTATVVSVCALVATFYQTYIMRQQYYAEIWPRLDLAHGWRLNHDQPFYRLTIRNLGVGPAIIRKVTIKRGKRVFNDLSALAKAVAQENQLDKQKDPYANYMDLMPEMVIPQQESIEVLYITEKPMIEAFVRSLDDISVQIEYESLYGQSWLVTYPHISHKSLD
jgi:hypothetical protein